MMSKTGWTKVTPDNMPPNGVTVLAFFRYDKSKGQSRIVRAFYTAARTIETDPVDDDEDLFDYDEEEDVYYVKEGWYEASEMGDTDWRITEEVLHWMPMPANPEAEF